MTTPFQPSPLVAAAQPHDRERLKKVLFVVGQLSLGGVETYILRVARALSASGVAVEVWIVKPRFDGGLMAQLQLVAEVRVLAPKWLAYPLWISAPELPEDADLVFTTGRLALIFAAHACASADRSVRLIAGVFSQWEYMVAAWDKKSLLANALVEQIGPANMVFCTDGCRVDHAKSLGESYLMSLVSPLLVDLPTAPPRESRSTGAPFKIVTVSRLVSFKTSNLQMPELVARLNASGTPTHWTLYGEGPERGLIEAAVKAAGAEAFITLESAVPYADLPRVMRGADLYIGAGSTLVEASALGVPALVALDTNPEPTTPGLLCDRPGVFTSDASDADVLTPIFDYVTTLSKLGPEAARELSRRSRQRVERYGTSQARLEYDNMLDHVAPVKIVLPFWFQLSYLVATFIEAARAMFGMGDRYGRNRAVASAAGRS